MELSLLFVGILVSLVVQFIKTRFKTTQIGTLLAVAVMAIVGSTAAYFLTEYDLYEVVLQILATAGAFYAFIIRTVEKDGVSISHGLIK
jgi:hypothetical protein